MGVSIESVIEKYMQLRTEKEAIEAEMKARVLSIKEGMVKLEAWLAAKADADGVDSFKTKHGTVFFSTTDFANVADWNAVLAYIKAEGAYDMLEKRVSKHAVRGYIDTTGSVPPGINYGTKRDVNVRRPTKKA